MLSPLEKNKLLTEREKRWETLDAECSRTLKTSGIAPCYELQEGIFLLCDEDLKSVTQKVSPYSSFRDHGEGDLF